jgi:hypothetical protein
MIVANIGSRLATTEVKKFDDNERRSSTYLATEPSSVVRKAAAVFIMGPPLAVRCHNPSGETRDRGNFNKLSRLASS